MQKRARRRCTRSTTEGLRLIPLPSLRRTDLSPAAACWFTAPMPERPPTSTREPREQNTRCVRPSTYTFYQAKMHNKSGSPSSSISRAGGVFACVLLCNVSHLQLNFSVMTFRLWLLPGTLYTNINARRVNNLTWSRARESFKSHWVWQPKSRTICDFPFIVQLQARKIHG